MSASKTIWEGLMFTWLIFSHQHALIIPGCWFWRLLWFKMLLPYKSTNRTMLISTHMLPKDYWKKLLPSIHNSTSGHSPQLNDMFDLLHHLPLTWHRVLQYVHQYLSIKPTSSKKTPAYILHIILIANYWRASSVFDFGNLHLSLVYRAFMAHFAAMLKSKSLTHKLVRMCLSAQNDSYHQFVIYVYVLQIGAWYAQQASRYNCLQVYSSISSLMLTFYAKP